MEDIKEIGNNEIEIKETGNNEIEIKETGNNEIEIKEINIKDADVLTRDIEAKRDICARARAIADADDLRDGALRLSNLLDEWKAIKNHHTPEEDELWQQFSNARTDYRNARENQKVKNSELKKKVIEKAAGILDIDNFKEAGEAFKALMTEWKAVGSAGRPADDELWNQFKAIRDKFEENRRLFFASQEENIKKALEIKENLIKEVSALVEGDMDDLRGIGDKMASLMEKWKEAGFAGREKNDSLWEEFNAKRQVFFDKRKEINAERDKQFEAVAEIKRGIIEKAKKLVALEDYGKENTDAVRELDAQWKAAGSAGKRLENELWEAFVEVKESFWSKKKELFQDKAKELVKKKKEQINNLYDQITKLKKSILNSTNWDRISQVNEWVAQKENIIAELKKEIKNLES